MARKYCNFGGFVVVVDDDLEFCGQLLKLIKFNGDVIILSCWIEYFISGFWGGGFPI